VRETLFCVFPSTSGRVVSHQVRCTCGYMDTPPLTWRLCFTDADYTQRDDKVALFKMLRDDLEHIKAGTLDTSCMRHVRLANDT
jgi:hypothetical protein